MDNDTDNLPLVESSNDVPPSGGDTQISPPVFTEDTGSQPPQAHAPPTGGGSLRDRALAGLPGDVRAAVVASATDVGVFDKNDATWILLRFLRDGLDTALTTERAASKIESSTLGIGETIYRQAQAAGKDLAAAAGQVIEAKTIEAGQGMVAVIQHAATAGAVALKAAATALPAAAAAQRGAILADWTALAASTAAQEAANRARKGEWWVIGASVVFGLVMAVMGGWVGYQLAPRAWPATSPPSLVANFPGETEFQWDNTHAFIPRDCPPGQVCVVLKK